MKKEKKVTDKTFEEILEDAHTAEYMHPVFEQLVIKEHDKYVNNINYIFNDIEKELNNMNLIFPQAIIIVTNKYPEYVFVVHQLEYYKELRKIINKLQRKTLEKKKIILNEYIYASQYYPYDIEEFLNYLNKKAKLINKSINDQKKFINNSIKLMEEYINQMLPKMNISMWLKMPHIDYTTEDKIKKSIIEKLKKGESLLSLKEELKNG